MLEGLEQGLDLTVASVEALGDRELIGDVAFGQREPGDGSSRRPLRGAVLEIRLQAPRALVSRLRGLGEEFQDDLGEGFRDGAIELGGGLGGLGDVAVYQLEGVLGVERRTAGEHLVEGRSQGVEVGPVVDDPVHAAGLLRRHVREPPVEQLGRVRRLGLLGQA